HDIGLREQIASRSFYSPSHSWFLAGGGHGEASGVGSARQDPVHARGGLPFQQGGQADRYRRKAGGQPVRGVADVAGGDQAELAEDGQPRLQSDERRRGVVAGGASEVREVPLLERPVAAAQGTRRGGGPPPCRHGGARQRG